MNETTQYKANLKGKKNLPDKWGGVVDPPATNPDNRAETSDGIDNHGSQRTSRVDSTSGEGNEVDVSQQDGEPNGQWGSVSGARFGTDGRVEDGNDQQEGSDHFQEKGGTEVDAVRNPIDTNGVGGTEIPIGLFREGTNAIGVFGSLATVGEADDASPHNEGSENGPEALRNHVQGTRNRTHLSEAHKGKSYGRVDVASRDISNAIGEDGDTDTKGKGNRELRCNCCEKRRKDTNVRMKASYDSEGY